MINSCHDELSRLQRNARRNVEARLQLAIRIYRLTTVKITSREPSSGTWIATLILIIIRSQYAPQLLRHGRLLGYSGIPNTRNVTNATGDNYDETQAMERVRTKGRNKIANRFPLTRPPDWNRTICYHICFSLPWLAPTRPACRKGEKTNFFECINGIFFGWFKTGFII